MNVTPIVFTVHVMTNGHAPCHAYQEHTSRASSAQSKERSGCFGKRRQRTKTAHALRCESQCFRRVLDVSSAAKLGDAAGR